jgi:acyl carrier protein
VEWIQAINRQYGTSIQSTRIYDYPSISKMANYLVKELPEQKEEIISAPLAHVQPSISKMANYLVKELPEQKEEIIQAPLAYVQLTISVESLREELKTSLAEVLRMKPDDVDVDIEFVDMGLDSVTGVEWIQAINKQYGTSIQSTRIYDYPSISKMANYLVKELPEQKGEIIQAPPIKSIPNLSLNEILHQVKSGVLDGEQAERLFAEVMNKLV